MRAAHIGCNASKFDRMETPVNSQASKKNMCMLHFGLANVVGRPETRVSWCY